MKDKVTKHTVFIPVEFLIARVIPEGNIVEGELKVVS